MNTFRTLTLIAFSLLILSCQNQGKENVPNLNQDILFEEVTPSHSNINFQNTIFENEKFNFQNYTYIYNGGGVSAGDINNDGLIDLYFTSNAGSNKLYINKGNFEFEDITEKAGVEDKEGWSTGTTMIDINNDGFLDIYVCKAGELQNQELRRNKLFINQGNSTFKEDAAAYGIDDFAFSTQAYFVDFDKDGDVDMYLVNHRDDFQNNSTISGEIQLDIKQYSSDKIYKNENGKFINFIPQGFNKTWGLSASIADFNDDGWYDIYVCNDFLEPDQLWINNKKGSFADSIRYYFDHISFNSMGSDVADINNDGKMDLAVLDMNSSDHYLSKTNMASMNVDLFYQMISLGYHNQYMQNTLFLNRSNGYFSEIGQLAGMSKTDWSWSPLFADFNQDGYQDLFITNGIKRDIGNNDFRVKAREIGSKKQGVELQKILDMIPSRKISNYMYLNTGEFGFDNVTSMWGLDKAVNSNGATYADLDNDGDLDLVTNNMEDIASIYKNNSNGNFVKLVLEGPVNNFNGIGAQVSISQGDLELSANQFLSRGFLSSVSPELVFGLKKSNPVTISIQWPDGKLQSLKNVEVNKTITLSYNDATENSQVEENRTISLERYNPVNINHQENTYIDFKNEILLPQMMSTLGPGTAIGDLNNDGTDDIFVSGALGMAPQVFIQNKYGEFQSINTEFWETQRNYEGTGVLFFDVDQDGDLDIYAVAGGNENQGIQLDLQDKLYINDGKGNFSLSLKSLPIIESSGLAICANDIDKDGDLDLFVGGRVVPGKYPAVPKSYILLNNNGNLEDATQNFLGNTSEIGMVTDAQFLDIDNNGFEDLVVVGEWMQPKVYYNNGSSFDAQNLNDEVKGGWWFSVKSGDFNNDGQPDFVLGNLGQNNKFNANEKTTFHVFAADFDGNGSHDIVLSKEKEGKLLPVRGRECSSQQMPFIQEKFPTYDEFASADLIEIYSEDKIKTSIHHELNNFNSIVLLSKKEGGHSIKPLNTIAQFGPLLDSELIDINNDGNLDIIGVGAIQNAEPETVKYDASKGFVLLGDGKGNFETDMNSGLMTSGNVKHIDKISINNSTVLMVTKNNGPVEFYKINKA